MYNVRIFLFQNSTNTKQSRLWMWGRVLAEFEKIIRNFVIVLERFREKTTNCFGIAHQNNKQQCFQRTIIINKAK